MTFPAVLPGAAAGFPLSLTQAARILEMTPDDVLDLVRTHCLGAYLAAAYETAERPALRFDPASLSTLAATLSTPPEADATAADPPVSELHTVAHGLRAYLAARTPTGDHQQARADGRPVLARARGRGLYAHVVPDVLREFMLATLPPGSRLRLRLTIPATIPAVLTRLGCVRVRGVRPLGETRQVWATWWRVPASIWSMEEADAARVDDYPAFGGAREPGEAYAADADGNYVVDGPAS